MQSIGSHTQGGVVAKISVLISLIINLIEMACFIIFSIELYRHKKRHRRLSRTYTSEIARKQASQVSNSKASNQIFVQYKIFKWISTQNVVSGVGHLISWAIEVSVLLFIGLILEASLIIFNPDKSLFKNLQWEVWLKGLLREYHKA